MSEPEARSRKAPLELWRAAQTLLNTLFNLFGEPQDIAQSAYLTRKQHGLIARWLRAAETMLRHLIFIEAAALDLAPAPTAKRLQRRRVRRLHSFYPADPQTWRVHFPCASVSRRAAARSTRRGGADADRFIDAFPLALRYEALLRAFNDPAPYARRLARRLSRAPQAAQSALAHVADVVAIIGEETMQALARAMPAPALRRDSS